MFGTVPCVKKYNHWSKLPGLFKINKNWLIIAYIALFSTLLSRLIVLACGSTWVTSFIVRFCFVFVFWISTEVVYLQCWHGWCHMKLQLSWRKSCVHHTSLQPCHFMQSHIRKVYACLAHSCNLQPALLAEWLGSFTCCCGNTGVEQILK